MNAICHHFTGEWLTIKLSELYLHDIKVLVSEGPCYIYIYLLLWSLIWILIIKIRTNIYLLLVTYFTDENSLTKTFLTRFYYWSNQLTNLETLKVSDLTKQSKINQSDISNAFVLFFVRWKKMVFWFSSLSKTKSIIILTLNLVPFPLLTFCWSFPEYGFDSVRSFVELQRFLLGELGEEGGTGLFCFPHRPVNNKVTIKTTQHQVITSEGTHSYSYELCNDFSNLFKYL